jgi:hypothetical protein
MPIRRPASVTAAGVMAIVYGSLFSLCGVCGLIFQATGNDFMVGADPMHAQMQKALEEAMEKDLEGHKALQTAIAIVGLGEAVALLIAGIGILYMRRWARTLAFVACLIAIATSLLQAIYQAVLVMPAMSRAFEVALPAALPQGGGPQAAELMRFMKMMMTIATVGGLILSTVFIVYLFVIVYLLCRRHVRAAFMGQGPFEDDDDRLEEGNRSGGYEDDVDWQEPR